MSGIYASPLRVYLAIGVLALAGIYSGLNLPVSLFPNSSKPTIGIWVPYGGATAQDFLQAHGRSIEGQLSGVEEEGLEVESLEASYNAADAYYKLSFRWGADPKKAQRAVESVVNAYSARLPDEVRNSIGIWSHRTSSGFLAVSARSTRSTRSSSPCSDRSSRECPMPRRRSSGIRNKKKSASP